MKTKFNRASLEEELTVQSLQKAIRLEMRKLYTKQDEAIIHLVLIQLIHENRLEILPNNQKR